MRYGEQTFEITVPLPGVDIEAPDLMDQVADAVPPAVTRSSTPTARPARTWCW
jgi:hypothetical protein